MSDLAESFNRSQFANSTAYLFQIPRVMAMEVMNGPKHDDCSQVIIVSPFVYTGPKVWRELIGVANEKDSVPDYEGLARMSGRRVEHHLMLAKADESWHAGFPPCICACRVTVDELMMTMFSH